MEIRYKVSAIIMNLLQPQEYQLTFLLRFSTADTTFFPFNYSNSTKRVEKDN